MCKVKFNLGFEYKVRIELSLLYCVLQAQNRLDILRLDKITYHKCHHGFEALTALRSSKRVQILPQIDSLSSGSPQLVFIRTLEAPVTCPTT